MKQWKNQNEKKISFFGLYICMCLILHILQIQTIGIYKTMYLLLAKKLHFTVSTVSNHPMNIEMFSYSRDNQFNRFNTVRVWNEYDDAS